MSHTLENSDLHSVFRQTMGLNELHLAPPVKMHLSPGLNATLNNYIDIQPPGVREQMPNPSMPYFGPYRSALYDHNGTTPFNNVPVPNYKDPMMPGTTPSWLMSDWHRRMGSAWFDILQETPVKESWQFRDYGQFSVPFTGFSAFSELVPRSTKGFL